jgi:hypothetical protein
MENNNKNTVMNSIIPFVPGSSKDTGPTGPLMNALFEYLKVKSVSYHVKQALLTIFTFISAFLGETITLVLSEQQGANGLLFLNTIGGIIPEIFKSEFSDLNKNLLMHNPGILKYKTVVANDAGALKRNSSILRNLVECGHVIDQALGKENGTKSINEIRIEGPTSIIVLVGQTEPKWLTEFSSALRLDLNSNPNFILEQLNMRMSQRTDQCKETILKNIIPKELQRLKSVYVDISFKKQIIDCLDASSHKSVIIIDTIIFFLNIITIINDATFETSQDRDNEYCGMDIHAILNPEKLIEQKKDSDEGRVEGLVATKVEYYILYVLIEGVFNFNEDLITGILRLIFDAIKTINAGWVFSSTTLSSSTVTEVEFVKALDNQVNGRGWASILEIKEKIEKDTGKKISAASIHRGVKELCERKFITRRKDPVMPNKFLYGVCTLSLDNEFTLPKPGTIIDPIYNGKPVDVINPVTGEKETI